MLETRGHGFAQQSARNVCAKVQSWSFQPFLYWSLSSVHNPETIAYRNSSNHENCNIKFSLNTFLIKLPSVKFLVKFYIFVVRHIYTWKVNIHSPWHRCFPKNFAKFLSIPFFTEHFGGASKYLGLLGNFPFLFHFSVEMKLKRNFQQKNQGERWMQRNVSCRSDWK